MMVGGEEKGDTDFSQTLLAIGRRFGKIQTERDLLEAARLPCFAIGMPQEAATSAVAVDIFKLWLPSPPVPQTSMAFAGASTPIIRARISEAAAVISIAVSPRSARPVRKAVISSAEQDPSNIAEKAARADASVRGLAGLGKVMLDPLLQSPQSP
jgi:hypothetical protein